MQERLFSPAVLGALINLNGRAHFVHWHFFQMSVSNIVVIVAMFAVFFAAILIPFPNHGATGDPR